MNKKIIIVIVSVVLVIAIFVGIIVSVVFSQSPNSEINRCYTFSKEYLKIEDNECSASLTTDKATQDEIEKYATEIIDLGSYEGYMYTTKYSFQYIKDSFHYRFELGDNIGVEGSYYYQAVILKLKVLLVQGRAEEFEELFSEYCYSFCSNIVLMNYIGFFVNDSNYPMEYNDDKYKIIENAYLKTIEESDDIQKLIVVGSLLDFYRCFEEETVEQRDYYYSMSMDLKQSLGYEVVDEEHQAQYAREYSHF